jgi:lipopolysaccharide assembly protein A
VLLFGAFLIGLTPFYVLHRATRWRLRRRLDNAERALADIRGSEVMIDDEPQLPPGALPGAVPPAV